MAGSDGQASEGFDEKKDGQVLRILRARVPSRGQGGTIREIFEMLVIVNLVNGY
jgi:hypothetical protein